MNLLWFEFTYNILTIGLLYLIFVYMFPAMNKMFIAMMSNEEKFTLKTLIFLYSIISYIGTLIAFIATLTIVRIFCLHSLT